MKTKPLKKIPETDMIFENVSKVRDKYEKDIKAVMISIDTKDKVKIGNFSRKGKCRYAVEAADHDFGDKFITPFGILDLTDNTVGMVLCFHIFCKVSLKHAELYVDIKGRKETVFRL
jgi:hypothetical protein